MDHMDTTSESSFASHKPTMETSTDESDEETSSDWLVNKRTMVEGWNEISNNLSKWSEEMRHFERQINRVKVSGSEYAKLDRLDKSLEGFQAGVQALTIFVENLGRSMREMKKSDWKLLQSGKSPSPTPNDATPRPRQQPPTTKPATTTTTTTENTSYSDTTPIRRKHPLLSQTNTGNNIKRSPPSEPFSTAGLTSGRNVKRVRTLDKEQLAKPQQNGLAPAKETTTATAGTLGGEPTSSATGEDEENDIDDSFEAEVQARLQRNEARRRQSSYPSRYQQEEQQQQQQQQEAMALSKRKRESGGSTIVTESASRSKEDITVDRPRTKKAKK